MLGHAAVAQTPVSALGVQTFSVAATVGVYLLTGQVAMLSDSKTIIARFLVDAAARSYVIVASDRVYLIDATRRIRE